MRWGLAPGGALRSSADLIGLLIFAASVVVIVVVVDIILMEGVVTTGDVIDDVVAIGVDSVVTAGDVIDDVTIALSLNFPRHISSSSSLSDREGMRVTETDFFSSLLTLRERRIQTFGLCQATKVQYNLNTRYLIIHQ